jgi:cytochrome P450
MPLLQKLAPVDVPGLPAVPLLGSRVNFLRFFADPIGLMLRLLRRHGRVAALTAGDASLVCAFGPEHNKTILSNAVEFPNSEELFFPARDDSSIRRLHTHLVFMNGEAHRRQRRLMMPALQKSAIDQYRDTIVSLADRALDRLPPGQTIDAAVELRAMMFRIGLKCFFGVDFDGDGERLGELEMEHLKGMVSVGAILFPFNVPGTPYGRLSALTDQLERELRRLVKKRRAQPEGNDLLSVFIRTHDEEGSTFTDDELIGLCNILMAAGHDTTAYTLAWTLFLLSQHPRVLADLRDELHGRLRGAPPTAAQIADLPLLDRVLKESMRILSIPAFLFIRVAAAPFQLGPYSLPKGSGVILSPFVTHHLPDLYPEPERFRPERWESIQPSPYEYMPLGAGPRMCIGASFAGLSLRLLLAMIVQRVGFELLPEARISRTISGVALVPKHGVPLRLLEPGATPRRSPVRGDIHELVALG